MPPTAIVKANVKVNEAELKKSASRARGTYSFLTPAQFEVGKRAAEYGVTATIRHYGIILKYPDLLLKESRQCA